MTFDIRTLDQSFALSAFQLATQVFAEGSTLHRALGIGLKDYRAYLKPSFRAMISEGLSVCAVDRSDGTLVGCLIVTDLYRQVTEKPCGDQQFAPLSALTAELCQQYQQKRDIKAGEVILVDMGAVDQNAGGQGIYQKMRSSAQQLAASRGFKRVAGELSSSATQHVVLNRLGHKKMAEVYFESFEFEGQRPFQSILDPKSIVLAEGEL